MLSSYPREKQGLVPWDLLKHPEELTRELSAPYVREESINLQASVLLKSRRMSVTLTGDRVRAVWTVNPRQGAHVSLQTTELPSQLPEEGDSFQVSASGIQGTGYTCAPRLPLGTCWY